VSNIITTWREAVVAHLQTLFPDADVISGQRTNVNRRDNPLIRVWSHDWTEMARDIQFATPTLTIRYFPTRSKQLAADETRDVGELEQARADLMAGFADKRKVGDLAAGLSCRITGTSTNDADDAWYVDATVTAYTLNLAAVGA
jgi:hypothetical protein